MAKFVQFGDLHLETPINRKYFEKEEYENGLRALEKIINFCISDNTDFLFITGDLFDGKHSSEEMIKSVLFQLKRLTNTEVFISPGNHDCISLGLYDEFDCDNIHVFKDFGFYEREMDENNKIRIYGAGFREQYQRESLIPNSINIDSNFTNILVIHGENIKTSNYNPVSEGLSLFDYVALGHIHKMEIVNQPNLQYAYSGCPIGRGFDETDEKGFIKGNITNKFIKAEFMPLAFPEFKIHTINVNTLEDDEILRRVFNIGFKGKNKYRIILEGEKTSLSDIAEFIRKNLSIPNYVEILDRTITVKNNFVKSPVIAAFLEKAEALDDEIKEEVIRMGLKVLNGRSSL